MIATPLTDAILDMRNLGWDQLQDHARKMEWDRARLIEALKAVLQGTERRFSEHHDAAELLSELEPK
jgi:hypothetical protein